VRELGGQYPDVDILSIDGTDLGAPPAQGAFRNEVLHALNRAQQADEAVWSAAPTEEQILRSRRRRVESASRVPLPATPANPLPELLGADPQMLEVSRRIRLVAPRATTVLVQGPTGTGKELVARALHRLSPRASRPFVAINCAAIPEALLEAELFGHTRGAFTGAVQGRTGRIEAADGGTLFLDEIGELPLSLQAKLLRFVECGEIQRVGENEPVRVDVRIIAATHRKLRKLAASGAFRSDLYYRLSVFLIQTPALAGRVDDIALLAQNALRRLAASEPAKQLTPEAWRRLTSHAWPGNVRELEHTLERAWILSEGSDLIGAEDIDFGEALQEENPSLVL
jgi:transcriptional regulator with PAS, ATPase and Fis domain